MRGFRGILLDFYGTLVHEDDDIIPVICESIRQNASGTTTINVIAQQWWSVFSASCRDAHGLSFVSQRELAIESLDATLRCFGASLDPVELISRQFAHWASPPIFPDAQHFLTLIAEAGIPACIVSNIDRVDLERALDFHSLQFDRIVTSDDVRSYKPRPEMFEAALAKLELSPGEVLHIGDSRTSDVGGAQNLGIPVAWINRTGKAVADDMQPDFSARNLDELATILGLQ